MKTKVCIYLQPNYLLFRTAIAKRQRSPEKRGADTCVLLHNYDSTQVSAVCQKKIITKFLV